MSPAALAAGNCIDANPSLYYGENVASVLYNSSESPRECARTKGAVPVAGPAPADADANNGAALRVS